MQGVDNSGCKRLGCVGGGSGGFDDNATKKHFALALQHITWHWLYSTSHDIGFAAHHMTLALQHITWHWLCSTSHDIGFAAHHMTLALQHSTWHWLCSTSHDIGFVAQHMTLALQWLTWLPLINDPDGEALAINDPDGEALAINNPDGEALAIDNPDGEALAIDDPDGEALAIDNPDGEALAINDPDGEALAILEPSQPTSALYQCNGSSLHCHLSLSLSYHEVRHALACGFGGWCGSQWPRRYHCTSRWWSCATQPVVLPPSTQRPVDVGPDLDPGSQYNVRSENTTSHRSLLGHWLIICASVRV
jgi:hypothetical protein